LPHGAFWRILFGMCFVSNVSDHYAKKFEPYIPGVPDWTQQVAGTGLSFTTRNVPPENIEELRKLIAEFKEMMAAAKRMDVVMKQPDCVDPEKAKLQERVAELEAKLATIAEAAK